jgi:hypothetical protein
MQRSFKIWKNPEEEKIGLRWNGRAKYNCVCAATGWTINRGDPIYYDEVNKKIYIQKLFIKN